MTLLITIGLLLSAVVALFSLRAQIADWVGRIIAPEHAQHQMDAHVRTENTQDLTIKALMARVDVFAEELADMRQLREQDALEIASLRSELTQLSRDRETSLAQIAELTTERDTLKRRVREQALQIRKLTARVQDLEQQIHQPGDSHDRLEPNPAHDLGYPDAAPDATTIDPD